MRLFEASAIKKVLDEAEKWDCSDNSQMAEVIAYLLADVELPPLQVIIDFEQPHQARLYFENTTEQVQASLGPALVKNRQGNYTSLANFNLTEVTQLTPADQLQQIAQAGLKSLQHIEESLKLIERKIK